MFFTYFPFWDWIVGVFRGLDLVIFPCVEFHLSPCDRFRHPCLLGLFLGMHIIDVDSNYGSTVLYFFSFLGVFWSWGWIHEYNATWMDSISFLKADISLPKSSSTHTAWGSESSLSLFLSTMILERKALPKPLNIRFNRFDRYCVQRR